MSFLETVEKARAFLERNGRVSLGALTLEFGLDEAEIEALVDELVEIQQVAVREGRALTWDGGNRAALIEPRNPRDYTPKHLAEKILQSKSAIEGERKQVTVLFADVVGSTAPTRELDPEQAATAFEPAFAAMIEAVHRYEGTVNKVQGDGIMALFGAPLAHKDHQISFSMNGARLGAPGCARIAMESASCYRHRRPARATWEIPVKKRPYAKIFYYSSPLGVAWKCCCSIFSSAAGFELCDIG